MTQSTRTQIYLTERQRRRLDEICRTRGVSLAEAVRDAVDQFVDHGFIVSCDALDATWGKAPKIEVPSRDEWDEAGPAAPSQTPASMPKPTPKPTPEPPPAGESRP